jgi:hypothetical protein
VVHEDVGAAIRRKRSAMISVSARLSQKKRLFWPFAIVAARSASRPTEASRWTMSLRETGGLGGSTTIPARFDVPRSHARIASGLPTVALRPMRWTSLVVKRAMRSITLMRCAPRSAPAIA